jgi:hypothetical protein
MAERESNEVGKQEDVSGSGRCCPTCGRSGPTQGSTAMTRSMDPTAMMSKLPAMCMTFMVIVPALLGLGVGVVIGRSATRLR